jgi:hypothetical protein
MTDRINSIIFKEELVVLDKKRKAEVKKSIILKGCGESTQIFTLALHAARNKLTSIDAKEGKPLSACTYDSKFNRYYVECVDYLDLGVIPISFSIKVARISHWECKIPMTENVIKKYLNRDQIQSLEKFQARFNDCDFDYFQLVVCY